MTEAESALLDASIRERDAWERFSITCRSGHPHRDRETFLAWKHADHARRDAVDAVKQERGLC